MNLTVKQLETLRHMLGINDPSQREPEPYRDHYAANHGDEEMIALQLAGAVHRYRVCQYYDWYATTAAGKAAAIESHKKIRWSKPKRIYYMYLDVSDVRAGLTFKEFLTRPEFLELRKAA